MTTAKDDAAAPLALKAWAASLDTPQRHDYLRLHARDTKQRYDAFRAAGFTRIEALSLTIGVPV